MARGKKTLVQLLSTVTIIVMVLGIAIFTHIGKGKKTKDAAASSEPAVAVQPSSTKEGVGTVKPSPTELPIQSLLGNAGFEQRDQLKWTGRGSAQVAITTEEHHSGASSLKISGRAQTWNGPLIDLTNVLKKGERYRFSVWIKYNEGPPTKSFNLQFENHTGGRTDYPGVGQFVVDKGTWTLAEGEYTIPSDSELTQYGLYIETPWKPDSDITADDKMDFYIDDVGMKEVEPLAFQQDIPVLKDVFKDYFPFGVATITPSLKDNLYSAFMKRHYGVLVAGNEMKPNALQPVEGTFNWTESDQFVHFAQDSHMLIRGHTLVWHNQISGWFFTDPKDPSKPATSKELLQRLETHIKTVVGRYKGQIHSWDVVNEVISDSNGLRGDAEGSKWKSIVGDVDGDGYDSDYIEMAFKYAHQADPKAKLIINDYGLESPGRKRDDMYDLVKRMLKKGIPVDGVGLQMHISIYGPTAQEIQDCMEKFASLKEFNPNFTVQVTEMDMSVYQWMEPKKTITDDLLKNQADQYKAIFNVFREQAKKGNLSMVVMWGGADSDSWLNNFPIAGRGDAGLLFDTRLQAKPAYWAIVNPGK